jgi:hypothetical protein
MKNRPFYWFAFLLCAAMLLSVSVLEWEKNKDQGDPNKSKVQKVVSSAFLLPAFRIDTDGLITSEEQEVMAQELSGNDAFADDVIFLVASSIRGRCSADHAHELAQMAVQSHLPVLSGISAALDQHPELRPRLYALVRHLAADAPCDRVVDIVIGKYRRHLDVATYAATFPDSYFDPTLSNPPMDFGGRDLASRAADPCTSIVYGALPLDISRSWQCENLRANARKHLDIDACRAIFKEPPKSLANVVNSDHLQKAMALSIYQSLQHLPDVCR